MANRRYPRMTERPDEFLVNPEWPLWNDLFCFFAPQQSVLKLYGQVDTPLYRAIVEPYPKELRWMPELSRLGISMNQSNQGYSDLRSYYTVNWFAHWPLTVMAHVRNGESVVPGTWGCDILSIIEPSTNVGAHPLFISQGLSSTTGTHVGFRITKGCDIGVDTKVDFTPLNTLEHHAISYDGSRSANGVNTYVNGKPSSKNSWSNSYTNDQWIERPIVISGRGGNSPGWVPMAYATITDVMWFRRVLSPSEIEQLADPANVDLRIGNVPLILSPRRRFWPVVTQQAAPSTSKTPWHLLVQSV
jgi:hypothetical protein